jgi:hypothetical protein
MPLTIIVLTPSPLAKNFVDGGFMKINFMEIRDTFLSYCMVNAVTHANKVLEITEKCSDGNYDVQFIINGVELPLEKTFKDIEKQIDDMVEKKAYDLIKEKLGDLTNIADEITEDLKRKAKEKLNLQYEED